ncbi:MAG: glucosaminidase domain-containing protein [Bacteroidota bacterium]
MMKEHIYPVLYSWRTYFEMRLARIKAQLTSPWTKLILLLSLALLFSQREINFSLSLNSSQWFGGRGLIASSSSDASEAQNVSLLGSAKTEERPTATTAADNPVRRRQLNYITTYRRVAETEMEEHGIPASITLAQGLLESGAGHSSLARRANNHFGIKCFSRSCSRGHCTNFDDDTHKDFFIVYDSPEESYASHSRVLKHQRYADLFELSPTDYRAWARGLSQAGYATDPQYANKLIRLIEEFDLHDYDLAR